MPSGEIVVIEHRLAAGIGRERVHSVLRLLEAVGDGHGRRAGIHAAPPGDALRGVAQRRRGHQAARIDGTERHVARMAAFTVACICAWLSMPFSFMPLAK